jgi:hypothetical protein
VVGFVGSVNTSYRVAESLTFFRRLHELRADAHLLCVSEQGDVLRARLHACGLPADSFSVVSSPYEAMPRWLARMHWGLLFLSTSFAKTGSMPTKLAEFLAMGVRPIQHGCNAEVSDRVRAYGSGLVLESLDEEGLRRAAEHVARATLSSADVERARALSQGELGLEAGVATYATLITRATAVRA